jgi:dienelactone hydrolase
MKAKIFVCLAGMAALLYASGCRKKTAVGEEIPIETGIDAEVETRPHDLVAVTKNINGSVQGYYVALPSLYQQTTKKYPVILFFTGGGQTGNGSSDLPLLAKDGIMQLVVQKKFPPNVESAGRNNSFVIFCPQFTKQPTAAELLSSFEYMKANYRIDTTRIYMSGLSNGGVLASELTALIPQKFAALVTMAGVFSDPSMASKCSTLVAARLPVWSFHNQDDFVIPSAYTVNFINMLRAYKPAIIPRLTIFPSPTHDSWTPAINPDYRENKMNIYEFMLKYHR